MVLLRGAARDDDHHSITTSETANLHHQHQPPTSAPRFGCSTRHFRSCEGRPKMPPARLFIPVPFPSQRAIVPWYRRPPSDSAGFALSTGLLLYFLHYCSPLSSLMSGGWSDWIKRLTLGSCRQRDRRSVPVGVWLPVASPLGLRYRSCLRTGGDRSGHPRGAGSAEEASGSCPL